MTFIGEKGYAMENIAGTKSLQVIDQSVDKDHLNYLNSMQDAPAVRLEAEFYQADDIDGVAESAAGAGNLNYLVLQSQQTNDASALNDPFHVMSGGDNIFGKGSLGGGASAEEAESRNDGNLSDDDSGAVLIGNDDHSFGIGGITGSSDSSSLGTGLSVAGASALKGHNSNNSVDESSSTDITNIVMPNNPDTPDDPDNPDDTDNPPEDDYDLDVDIDTPIVDIGLDGVLDPLEDIVGDIDIDIDTIVDDILPGVHGFLPDVASDVISGVEDMLPDALVQPVHEIADTILDLTGLGADVGDIDLVLNLGSVIPGFIVFNTAFDIPLNPVELLLGDIDITADAQALAENLGTHTFALLGDLQQQDMSSALETVVGESSVLQGTGSLIPELAFDLDAATDILPDFSDSVSTGNFLEDITSITDGVLPAGGLPDADTDLLLNTGLETLGIEIPDINLDVPLDPVESLLGDIDIGLDAVSATDLENVESILNDAMAGDIGGIIDDMGTNAGLDTHLDLLGDNDMSIDILPDNLGGATSGTSGSEEGLSDAVGSLLGSPAMPDVLPDPVGTLTEGMGQVIDTTPVLGGLGGLLGGGGGGLFG